MSRYRKIDTRIWNDAKFREMSERGQLIFLFSLTHPNMTMLGAMRTTIPGLAAEYGHETTEKAFREAFQEALSKGMAKHDEKASFMWFPNFLKYNKPESPNVVKAWPEAFDMLPECAMKDQLLQHLKAFVEGLSEAFGKAFWEAFGEAFPKAMPNQEQEPEQEPDKNSSSTKSTDGDSSPEATVTPQPPCRTLRKTAIPQSVLEEIYRAYPKRVGKEAALRAIKKSLGRIGPTKDAEWLLGKTRAYALQIQGQEERFIPHPATWFNDGRYDDEAPLNRANGHNPAPAYPAGFFDDLTATRRPK
jgi:hypothetical protein